MVEAACCILHFNPLSLTVVITVSGLRTYVSHGIAKVGDHDDDDDDIDGDDCNDENDNDNDGSDDDDDDFFF